MPHHRFCESLLILQIHWHPQENTAGSRVFCHCRKEIEVESRLILLMEEILLHLGFIKHCKQWDWLPVNWCRISSINDISSIVRYLAKVEPFVAAGPFQIPHEAFCPPPSPFRHAAPLECWLSFFSTVLYLGDVTLLLQCFSPTTPDGLPFGSIKLQENQVAWLLISM